MKISCSVLSPGLLASGSTIKLSREEGINFFKFSMMDDSVVLAAASFVVALNFV
jgi:hypothetical protein